MIWSARVETMLGPGRAHGGGSLASEAYRATSRAASSGSSFMRRAASLTTSGEAGGNRLLAFRIGQPNLPTHGDEAGDDFLDAEVPTGDQLPERVGGGVQLVVSASFGSQCQSPELTL